MSDRLGAEWRDYRTKVIPLDAPQIQAQECRRAFYAGAEAFLRIVMSQVEPGDEPTDQDLRLMDELSDELKAFARSVATGRT